MPQLPASAPGPGRLLQQLILQRQRQQQRAASVARLQSSGRNISVRRQQQQQQQRRAFSSRKNSSSSSSDGKIKIPAQMAVFSLLLVPAVGFALYAQTYGPDEAELQARIRERYGQEVAAAHAKNNTAAMSDFFKKAITNADQGAEDERLEQVLHGGKGAKKRFHAVDKELYGTEAGVEERHRMEEELKLAALEKKKEKRKRRRKKAAADEPSDAAAVAAVAAAPDDATMTEADRALKEELEQGYVQKPLGSGLGIHRDSTTTQIVVIATVVGTLAALAGFLAGGGARRN